MEHENNSIEVENEADMPQEIDSDVDFLAETRLIRKTKTEKNINISIFPKYLLNIWIKI